MKDGTHMGNGNMKTVSDILRKSIYDVFIISITLSLLKLDLSSCARYLI